MEEDKIVFKGSHIDSLHRVPNSSIGDDRVARALRMLRWPVALVAVCIALAVFVYFLMPDNLDRDVSANGTYWEQVAASTARAKAQNKDARDKEVLPAHLGTKTPEIDFYEADNEKLDFTSIIDPKETDKIKLPVQPVFPKHVDLEVQYGNEKADSDKLRAGKALDQANTITQGTTLKPHITQKPEKPLAVYFIEGNEETTTTTEAINRAETINEFTNYGEKQTGRAGAKSYGSYFKVKPANINQYLVTEPVPNTELIYSAPVKVNFTSGHSNLFGISIEDAEKMRSTTQSSLYNTRVSPTLPTWRDRDTTTKKYPVNVNNNDVSQCRSTRQAVCRGVLPYDLAGPPANIAGSDVTIFLPQIEYMVSTNCSDRLRHFVCALMEPECNAPPYPTKMPCYNLCKAVVDSCEGYMPRELSPIFQCGQYLRNNCVDARAPCYQREFTCRDQTCVPRDWVCDGNRDCPNGEDELPCSQCEKDEFRCNSGNCIHRRWICDGYSDCPGGEDEDGCGRQTGQEDLGEESAGSAPAPAIRRPGRVSSVSRGHRTGESDSSKELLITSDTSNALKRNFTRRPSPSRLSPYRTSVSQTVTQKKPFVPENPSRKNTQAPALKPNLKSDNNDSQEDVNIGDLGFLEDSKKDVIKSAEAGANVEMKPKMRHWTASVRSTTTPAPTKLDQSLNKMERVINGAALMKAAAEEEYSPETNITNFEDEQPIASQQEPKRRKSYSAHSSPCPSGELRCVDGRCITLSQLCDGTIDCTDHADEDNCYT